MLTRDARQVLPPTQLDAIRDAMRELDFEDADALTRRVLLDNVRRMELALLLHRIRGPIAIADALGQVIGSIAVASQLEPEVKVRARPLGVFIRDLAELLKLVEAAKSIGDSSSGLLE